MAQTEKNNDSAKLALKELQAQGYYLKLDRHRNNLFNINTGIEHALDGFINPADRPYVLKSLHKIRNVIFEPAQPTLKPIAGLKNHYDFNSYKGYSPASDVENDLSVRLVKELFERLFPVESERKVFIQFIAHTLQKPEERPSFAVMLLSDGGTGKSVLFERILTPLVNHRTQTCNLLGQLSGKGANALFQTMFCFMDDIRPTNHEGMTKIKTAISEPQVRYEPKGIDSYMIKTFTRIILASNVKVPVPIRQEDTRRWFVPQWINHRESLAETQQFIEKLLAHLDLDAIYHHLMQVDISDFDPYMAPDTRERQRLVGNSKPLLEKEIDEYLQNHLVFHWDHLKDSISNGYFDKEIKEHLIQRGYESKRVPITGGRKPTVWKPSTMTVREVRAYLDEDPFLIPMIC